MNLRIKPHHINKYPIGGFIIKSPSAQVWFEEIHQLEFALSDLRIYPLPDNLPNSVWGCLILTELKLDAHKIGKHELCQQVYPNFYIPEKSVVVPAISPKDNEALFPRNIHFFHPEIGFVELVNILFISELVDSPTENSKDIIKAESTVFIPQTINSFQVKPLEPEEVLRHLEQDVFPKSEKMPDEPLTPLEKGKLEFYRMIFDKKDGEENAEEKPFFSKLKSFTDMFNKDSNWTENMKEDYEELERRNQSQMEKFMDMLKNDPEEALKYAIPLDHNHSNRGEESKNLDFNKRWGDFSLFEQSSSSGGGGSINIGDHFMKLDAQYRQTAKDLIAKGEYQKAAFIYMKLLKDYHQAALTLENGKFYQEAAMIYLKHLTNKKKAAECYEKGNMIFEAIELYLELNDYQKVADLYASINKLDEARIYYEKVASILKQQRKYIEASDIYRNKLGDAKLAQKTLLEGWSENIDAYSCLRKYFDHIYEIKLIKSEIDFIYEHYVNEHNRSVYLKILYHEFKKQNELSAHLKELAYQIISAEAPTNSHIVEELKKFNKSDKELLKDTSRFKYRRMV
ncbi:hypothetical protein [Chondrinema litorale]|uniref:hypothetical protein n=1 Tax=Chondrinema litorale TaxID=2994555 RepID=UPI002543CFA2|nr:hypothetical protein [Chondrinema litorale]UZR97430.1 hypothetical protein OQ292_26850 [Chondrinema litorale]